VRVAARESAGWELVSPADVNGQASEPGSRERLDEPAAGSRHETYETPEDCARLGAWRSSGVPMVNFHARTCSVSPFRIEQQL